MIFNMVKGINIKKPLDFKMLSDPNNHFVQTIIYIYSMQSFIFREINKTTRNKDVEKIKYYGPFAAALSFIVHCGNMQQTDLKKN